MIDFFAVGSAEDLAAKMIHHLRFPPARPEAESTLSMLRSRQREMAKALLEALQFARRSCYREVGTATFSGLLKRC